jgi:hypothetical protein
VSRENLFREPGEPSAAEPSADEPPADEEPAARPQQVTFNGPPGETD